MSIADMMSKMGGEEKKSPSARNKVRDGGHEPGSIAEHLKQMQAAHGGQHMHIHHDGGLITTHHVGEDGQVRGPHDHEDMESVKNHADEVFGEGGNEEDGEPRDRGGDRGIFD